MTRPSDSSAHAESGAGPFVGTNWKMTLTPTQARSYAETLREQTAGRTGVRAFVMPPHPAIGAVADVLAGSSIAWGAQDVHPVDRGAHTGDVSAPMLADLGCSYVAVGHYERRRDHGEDEALIAAKAAAVQRWAMTAVLCVGEPERLSRDDAIAFLATQLNAAAGLSPERLLIAYEPGWAIGEGRAPAEIGWTIDMHRTIHGVLARMFAGAAVPVIAGGSVDLARATRLCREPDVAGVFVGRNALDPRSFATIIRACDDAARPNQEREDD